MKKKALSREFKIGVFGIAMIALLYFSINFIKSNRVFSNDLTFYAVFESADGLEASAPVMARGFRIGTVEKVQFDLEKQNIIVTLSVQKEYPIAVGSKVKITSSGLLGGTIVQVDFTQNELKYKSKDTLPSSFEPGLMQMVGMEYGTLKDKLAQYSIKIDTILGGLSGVMSQKNVENIESTLNNIDNVTGNLNAIVANKKNNIENIIKNLDLLSKELKEAMPKFNATLDNISKASDSLPDLMANAQKAVKDLSEVMAKMNKGEGNLGKLVSDEQVYQNLQNATNSLNVLLADIKENPKRYVNITVFGKKTYEEKQADKAAKKADQEAKKTAKK